MDAKQDLDITAPHKLATILLLAFSLFKLVPTLLQYVCSESPYLP